MRLLSLRAKIAASIAAAALLSLGITAGMAIGVTGPLVSGQAADTLALTLSFHKTRIESFFSRAADRVTQTAAGFAPVQAVHEFEEAVYYAAPSLDEALGALRGVLGGAPGEGDEERASLYIRAHQKYDPYFRKLASDIGASEITLAEPLGGYVLYSTSGATRLGARLFLPEMEKTALGRAARAALDNPGEPLRFSGFENYPGSGGKAMVAARPVIDEGGVVAMLTVALPQKKVEELAGRRYGKDDPARVYLTQSGGAPVGPAPPAGPFVTGDEMAVAVMEGNDGASYLGASALVDALGPELYITALTPENDVSAQLDRLKLWLAASAVPVAIIGILFFYLVEGGVASRIHALSGAMKDAASSGEFASEKIPEGAHDEIGALIHYFNDIAGRFAAKDVDIRSRNESLSRYADSVAEEAAALREELKKKTERLEAAGESAEESQAQVERLQKDLDRQKRKLETASGYLKDIDEAKDRFLFTLEDELEGKLTSLAEAAGNGEQSERLKDIGIVLRRATSYFRLEAEYRALDMRRFDLAMTARETVERLAYLARGKKQKLSFSGEEGGVAVFGDKGQIRVAMENLLENAIKYTPEKGEVRVTVRTAGGMARFEVRDTGQGVVKERIPEIFERFYRADSGQAEDPGGMGLGLYVCRLIIRRHDGRIGADSEPGKGSLFFFELSRNENPQGTIPGI